MNATTTFELQAVTGPDGKVAAVKFFAFVPTVDEGKAIVAALPKSLRFTANGTYEMDHPVTRGCVDSGWIKLTADIVNGGRNEAGIKRIRKAMATLPYVINTYFANSATADQLAEALK